jgi:quercetin dioxygenase-like cupin family protein
VGAVSEVSVVALDSVPDIELPNGSFSRMLVTAKRAAGATASLGYSVFRPGTELGSVAHDTEEFAYVASGSGRLRLDDREVEFRAGDALHIPAGVWHAVVNDGDVDVVMVFGFPYPDYPPTERR